MEHLPINWVNGLKLTANHFFGNYHSVMESLYRSTEERLTDYNYGLGKSFDNSNENVEFAINGESLDTLSVRLKMCNAITRSGLPVLFYEEIMCRRPH